MALIKCKECGKDISDEAKTCPSCGHQVKKNKKVYGCGTVFLCCFFVIFLLIILGKLGSKNNGDTPKSMQTSPQWFKGGTLHKSTFAQWDNSTHENRLATSADFIISLSDPKNRGMFFKDDYKLLRQFATAMEKCISEGNKKDGKLIYDKATVNEFAVNCWIMMGQQLPKK